MKKKYRSIIPISFIFGIFFYIVILILNNRCNEDNSYNVKSNYHISGNKYIDLDRNSFKDIIENKKGLSMILFYRDECPFCEKFEPNFEILANEYQEKVYFGKINLSIEENLYLADDDEYDINSVPSISIFKDGKRIKVFENDEDKRELDNLKKELNKYL